MARAFSLTSESLSYFIGYTLLHARRVIIVSPWLSDVQIRFPVNNQLEKRQMNLLSAISKLEDTDVTFIVASEEEHNDFVRDKLPEGVTMIEIENLHAKVIVCDEFVYLGSANITQGGLKINREICEIIENEYQDAETYIAEELDITLPGTGS